MTTGGPSVPPGRAHRVLAGILVLSAALSLVGMSWGLPTPFSGTWAWDELSPDDRPTLARTHHGGRYPPLHYYVLAAFYAPVDWLDLPEVESTNAKRYVGRSVSLAMSLAALLVLYRLGLATLRAPGPSLLAVAVLALSPTFAYYSKTANLEVPYLLWLLVAVLFSVRILRHHRRRDYWGYALASLAAITTKDQAFGLLVLPSLVMPFALARHRDGAIRPRGVVAALLDRRLILPALTSFLAFFVIHNVVFDFEGFRHHLWIMVRGSGKFREHEPTLAGHLAMARQAVQHVGFVMGVPAALAAVGGLWSLAREHRRTAVWLSLFPISYYLF
ncbi:MAG: glycosyltransferase family 39 protein, partial [Thermoanaerobaculia bacterium]|nr:glycosyltransferase family 39 protein [Thermoanaerobaculia bacterium]